MISKLNPNQRKTIEEIGFGSLLSLKVEKVPSVLGYWLVKNYDPDENTLDIGSRKINVTAAEAREIFGVPMGKIIMIEYERPRYDEVLDWFKSQFPTKIAVRTMLPDVTKKLEKQTDYGWEFIVNLLVVFGTVFGNTMRNTTANKIFLHHIRRDADIKNLNWCEYIVSCLKREKRLWDEEEPFCGPLSFLAMLYAHDEEKRKKENIGLLGIQYINDSTLISLQKDLQKDMQKLCDKKDEQDGLSEQDKGHEKLKRMKKKTNSSSAFIEKTSQETVESKTPNARSEVAVKADSDAVSNRTQPAHFGPANVREELNEVDVPLKKVSFPERNTDNDLNEVEVAKVIEETPFLKVNTFDERLKEISFPEPTTAQETDLNKNEAKLKRKAALTYIMRSPFVERPVVMNVRRTKFEDKMCKTFFCAFLCHSDVVFTTKADDYVPRDSLESLCPGVEVHLNVISAWARILNYQEKFKNTKSPSRLFCSPVMLFPTHYNVGVKKDDRYVHFESNMESILKAEELQSLEGIELVFIPIIFSYHYYLLVFNMKKNSIDLLDNSAAVKEFKKKYGTIPEKMITLIWGLVTFCNNSQCPLPGIVRTL
ncbi:hypothetical protein SSX86_016315 [Deinandra increscens subsp. villosa]|uniref:Ubiquitin-like protease family profile domain-containing protein n=1 Tax=Deinandra increscens subsp. villosa TaxID=3103831 RepID=A0AAP0GY96_9ASTR